VGEEGVDEFRSVLDALISWTMSTAKLWSPLIAR
jgi:hypothetical protein